VIETWQKEVRSHLIEKLEEKEDTRYVGNKNREAARLAVANCRLSQFS
jgi:hypothetical protein